MRNLRRPFYYNVERMPDNRVEEVYNKIVEFRKRRGKVSSVPIDIISEELAMSKDIVAEYVTALQILDLI